MRRQLRVRLQLLYCTDEFVLLFCIMLNGSDFRELSLQTVLLPAPRISLRLSHTCVPDILFFPAESQSGERRGPTTAGHSAHHGTECSVVSGLIDSFVGRQFVRSVSVVLFH